MLAELGMDWLVEVTTERYYGPTTLGAIQEFVRLGEINAESFVINTCDGSRRQIHEIEPFFSSDSSEANGAGEQSPAAAGMSIEFEERIRDLERSLREERRALQEAEARYRELEQRIPAVALRVPRSRAARFERSPVLPPAASNRLCSQSRAYFPPNSISSRVSRAR